MGEFDVHSFLAKTLSSFRGGPKAEAAPESAGPMLPTAAPAASSASAPNEVHAPVRGH